MSLVVETGSGNPNADAYISVADADTFLASQGNTTWADLDTEDKESALRRAAAYMTQEYRLLWAGTRVRYDQGLDWPRYGVVTPDAPGLYGTAVVPTDVVPREVRQANALLAVKALAGDLSADEGAPVIEETVGPITTKYANGARQSIRYTSIDNMLAPYFGSSSRYTFRIKRA